MSFDVAATAYDRFIGRYSRDLAPRFLGFAGVTGPASAPALDVGCGPGVLAEALAARLGAAAVAAVDTSEPFVAACRARLPGADVRVAPAEALPFESGTFGAALAQLVLSFVKDADQVARELTRVVRPGGVVAASTFEASGFTMVRAFWEAALALDPAAPDDARLPYRRLPELVGLWRRAGLHEVVGGELEVEARYAGFDDLWEPFAFGIGPAAGWFKAQPEERKVALREGVLERLGRPEGPFALRARVVAVRGVVAGG